MPYQDGLICALCSESTDDVGYRMWVTIAICNTCVNRLIEDELKKLSIVVLPLPKGIQ